MKLNGFVGKGSGKLGSSVFAISGGEQIVREYNPRVANPNTTKQVNQRAKFKLMSQLAAEMAMAMAFKKTGLKSARNQFVSKNIKNAYIENGDARVNLISLQITAGNTSVPGIVTSIGENNALHVELATAASEAFEGIVYNVFRVDDDNKIKFVKQVIVNIPGADGKFATDLTTDSGAFVVYAYGIKANDAKAKVDYQNYVANMSDEEATLSWTDILNISNYALSYTVADTQEV